VDGAAKLKWNHIGSPLPDAHHTSLASGLNCFFSKEMYSLTRMPVNVTSFENKVFSDTIELR
jgi:hypothetical protein